ncbi:MAG TPA: AlpA family phage regulatory protein [Methylibium sp.]|uniref:helix-turn-helix transcriptional regulator n=1 Tax=Methylibium sp. TaxID=2067992 RepID=UPI002DB5914E|nr:AlpA family phage regulatory protein [Methylibium sp.]HEU4457771.1 AlpA family phage regulatory protein [Methylibium sp.]
MSTPSAIERARPVAPTPTSARVATDKVPQPEPVEKAGAGRTAVTPEQIAAAQDDDALLPWPVVVAMCALSRSTLTRMSREGGFPPGIRLGPRCTRFKAGAIRRWLNDQAAR